MKVTKVGIDLAKNVFHFHGVNKFGKTVIKKAAAQRPDGRILRQLASLPARDGSLRQRP